MYCEHCYRTLAVDAISQEENLQGNKEISDFFKNVFRKGKGNENLMP